MSSPVIVLEKVTLMHSHTPLDINQRNELTFTFENTSEYWCGGDVVLTHFFNALSMFGPVAERFLIGVVRSFDMPVLDKKLSEDCEGFIRQEAMHSRVHTDYNKYVASFGYDLDKINQTISTTFDVLLTRDSRTQLDVGRAAEHLIYEISMLLLKDKELTEVMEPEVMRMFHWHAMEEIEHSSVCHDLYVYIYGESYFGRMKGFLMGGDIVIKSIRAIYEILMKKSIQDGVITKSQSVSGWRSLWIPPHGIIAKSLLNSSGYADPTFRPWHNFTRDLPLLEKTEKKMLETNPVVKQ